MFKETLSDAYNIALFAGLQSRKKCSVVKEQTDMQIERSAQLTLCGRHKSLERYIVQLLFWSKKIGTA